ncbi:MAG: hypothetical protein JWM09_1209 [Francisellaceae bacterium]|nr:hypothetical protein [Francisellaceae bacterium]
MVWNIKTQNSESVCFENKATALKKISELNAQKYDHYLHIALTLTDNFYNKLYEHFEFHSEFGFSQNHAVFMTDMGNHCTLTLNGKTEKNVLIRFLFELHKFEAYVGEIIPKIKHFFGIHEQKEILKDIEVNLKVSVDAAMTRVHYWYKQGARNAFILLAKACFEASLPNDAIRVLARIPDGDHLSHFEAANILIKRNDKNAALNHLFKAGDDPVVQSVRDNLWAIECSLDPSQMEVVFIPNVKMNDAETFVAIADKIRDIRTETLEQEGYIEKLERHLKELSDKTRR